MNAPLPEQAAEALCECINKLSTLKSRMRSFETNRQHAQIRLEEIEKEIADCRAELSACAIEAKKIMATDPLAELL